MPVLEARDLEIMVLREKLGTIINASVRGNTRWMIRKYGMECVALVPKKDLLALEALSDLGIAQISAIPADDDEDAVNIQTLVTWIKSLDLED